MKACPFVTRQGMTKVRIVIVALKDAWVNGSMPPAQQDPANSQSHRSSDVGSKVDDVKRRCRDRFFSS